MGAAEVGAEMEALIIGRVAIITANEVGDGVFVDYDTRMENLPQKSLFAKYSETLVRNVSAMIISTDATTTACVVARPTP